MIVIKDAPAEKQLEIEVRQINGTVEIHHAGHPFVIMKRDHNGNAVVGLNDADTGCRDWNKIGLLCSKR